MSNLPRPDRAYPVPPLHGDDGDPRFSFGLTLDVAEILKAHQFPPLGALDIVQLQQALFRFLYGETPAQRAARERPILCAHADDDGRGAHWLQPGQPCDRAPQGGEQR